jgi:hypothetical protein
MGQMHFVTPPRGGLPKDAERHACVVGLDLIPMPVRGWWGNDRLLHLERDGEESGYLCIPWNVAGRGPLMLRTSTLVDRQRPYLLPVELARGTLNRLRNRAASWQAAGLGLSSELNEQLKLSMTPFIDAVSAQHDEETAIKAAELAQQRALDAMETLGREYVQQVFAQRQPDGRVLSTLLGGNLGSGVMPRNTEPMFKAAFNTGVVPIRWSEIQPGPDQWEWAKTDKQVQWCQRHGVKIVAGPIASLRREMLPAWIREEDLTYDGFQQQLDALVTATVQRYRGQVHLWHAAGGTNVPQCLPFNDEHRLRLTMLAVQRTHALDPRTPVFVSMAQPWGEYLLQRPHAVAPLHFAELLVRADLGVAGVGLEVNLGCGTGCTYVRDLLEINDFIDVWGLLGLPLIVMLSVPSGPLGDSRSGPSVPGRPLGTPAGVRPDPRAGVGPQRPAAGREHKVSNEGVVADFQRHLVDQLAPLLVAKQSVHGLFWTQVFDSQPQPFSDSGLFDERDLPKPGLSSLISLRREHLD